MVDNAQNQANDFLDDLEYEEDPVEPIIEEVQRGPQKIPSGASAAARMKREDKYRLPYVNFLDVAGWIAGLVVIWIAYTMIMGVYGYFAGSSEEISPERSAFIEALEKERVAKDLVRKRRFQREELERREAGRALSAVEERIADFDPQAYDEESEFEEEVEPEKRKKRSFSLGRAISDLLSKDLRKSRNARNGE